MRIIFDDDLSSELKQYLITQDGIEMVDILDKDLFCEINIKFDKITTPEIIVKYIYLFQKKEFPTMMEFDKGSQENYKVLKYVIDDICCEYCYKGLIQDLFENKFVISVKSNFNINKPAYNIELFIKYNDNYDEKQLIQYIKEKI